MQMEFAILAGLKDVISVKLIQLTLASNALIVQQNWKMGNVSVLNQTTLSTFTAIAPTVWPRDVLSVLGVPQNATHARILKRHCLKVNAHVKQTNP